MTTGTVLYGINNIFTIQAESSIVECRIKGKILGDGKKEYNPLAPGDNVFFETDIHDSKKGMIIQRLERRNAFLRWNKKRKRPQGIAANIDGIMCISSPQSPPFRPRFIDRVAVSASIQDIPFYIVLNKCDQEISPEIEERLAYFQEIGISIITGSAKTGKNMDRLSALLSGNLFAFIGQSGVGKSTILNRICEKKQQKTGSVSTKHNRGTHTTMFSVLLSCRQDITVIDTPGIREIEVYGIEPEELSRHFPEMEAYADLCDFPGCTHLHEPGCSVREAVESGRILYDRYESYSRIFHSLMRQKRDIYE